MMNERWASCLVLTMGFLFFANSFLSYDRISSTTITSSSQRTSWLLLLTRNSYCWCHLLLSLLFSFLLLIYCNIISKKTKQRQQQQQKQKRQNRQQQTSSSSSSSSFTMQRLMLQQQKQEQRKLEFLSRFQYSYGYKGSPGGYIDDWRPIEFPSLISPINLNSNDDDNYNNDNNKDKEIYFDYAGSAIPTQTQLLSQATATTIYANPHSTGPAASRTFQKIKEANHLVLKHFNGLPDGHKLAMLRQQQQQESSTSILQDIYNHSGYEILFTSGTTESLRLIAEHFPWNKIKRENNSSNVHNINHHHHHHHHHHHQQQQQHTCNCGCYHQRSASSILLYAHNSHNSVIGMRQVALNHEAKFYCRTIQQIENMTKEDYINLRMENKSICSNHDDDDDRDNGPFSSSYSYPNLLAFPMECNFGGYRSNDISKIIETARSAGFYVMLDVAKAAGTGPVDFKCIGNPDFVCCSFYKMFGSPTGLGALFVNRHTISTLFLEEQQQQQPSLLPPPSTSSSSASILSSSLFSQTTMNDQQLYYVGGGSVDINLPKIHYCVPRTCPSPISSWTSGSIHFRGIIQLHDGFKELMSRGGMNQIHQHTTCLSNELVKRLEMLYHKNGLPVAEIYRYNDVTTATNNTNDAERQEALESQAKSNNNRYGPTVAFNLLRDDGSIVGYNEVSKLAALSQPPIQFRTGCFCNPGACQEALGITDEQAISNYETSGHVCGGHLDVIDGRPTGAIRISFGKDSIWEDLDTFVLFVERTFVNHHNDDTTLPPIISKTKPRVENGPKEEVRLSEIYVFPIKSCAAQSVSRWKLELPSGKLLHDREFALVDSSGTAMRLQSYPKMALIQPVVDLNSGTMRISAPGCEDLVIDLNTCGYHTTTCSEDIVKVCGNKCGGRLWGDNKVSEWFSSYLGVSCWLARFSNGNYKTAQQLLQRRDGVQPKTSFANEQPILLISQNAVDTLNEVLRVQNEKLVGTRHFRPNLVVQSLGVDDTLHVEDDWVRATVSSKGVLLSAKGSCARCAMVDFDPTTGSKHGKTLKALARYRRRNGQITFGIFLQASTMIERGGGNIDNDETEDVWLEIGDELKYDI